jgi:hypothetical protein
MRVHRVGAARYVHNQLFCHGNLETVAMGMA